MTERCIEGLQLLEESGGAMPVADYRAALNLSKNACTRDVEVLNAVSLINKSFERPGPNRGPGRPRVIVSLTDEGRAAVTEIRRGLVPIKLAIV